MEAGNLKVHSGTDGSHPMKIFSFGPEEADAISLFESHACSAVHIGESKGKLNVYCLYFEPDGVIGEHPTGSCQLLLVMKGSGWVSGADGVRVSVLPGQGAFFNKGEQDSKGSDSGMVAATVQSDSCELVAPRKHPESGGPAK